MGKFLSLTGRILSPLSKILTKMVVLPIMAVYIKFRGRLAKKSNNAREKIILLFSNRYVIHLFIILIALGVAIGNVSAYESRDDYGKNALIYKIVNLDSLEITEDNSVTVNQTSNPNYIDQNTQLNSNLAINNTGVDNQDQPSNDLNNIDNYIQNDRGEREGRPHHSKKRDDEKQLH